MAEKLTARQQALKIKAQQQAEAKAQQPTAPTPTTTNVTNIDSARDTRHQRYFDQAQIRIMAEFNASVEGTRNDALNKAAYALAQIVAGGWLLQGPTVATLRAAALAKGLGQDEIRRTMDSAWKTGWLKPRPIPEGSGSALDESEWLAELGEQDGMEGSQNGTQGLQTVEAVSATDIALFWETGTILPIIKQAAQARRVSPFAVLGVVFARMLTVTPHSITIPPLIGGIASLNLFIGLVGPSGAGKGSAVACAGEIFDVQDTFDGTTKRKIVNLGSGEGIVHTFRKKPNPADPEDNGLVNEAALFNVAEIDFLTATANRQGATIMPMLRSMWSGEQLGFQNADPTRRIQVPAHSYRATLVCGIQPMKAGALLNDATGGTPQRFTFLPTDDITAPKIPPPWPNKIVYQTPKSIGNDYAINANSIKGRNMVLPQHVIDQVLDQRLLMLTNQREASQDIAGHDVLNKIKLACCFALLRGSYTVDDQDWGLAVTLLGISLHQRSMMQNQLHAQARDEADNKAKRQARTTIIIDATLEGQKRHKAALRIITQLETATGPMSASDLRTGVRQDQREHFDDAISLLVDNSQIEALKIGDGEHYGLKK